MKSAHGARKLRKMLSVAPAALSGLLHALLEIASLLAHKRCQIGSPVRSHARLWRQHSGNLPMDGV